MTIEDLRCCEITKDHEYSTSSRSAILSGASQVKHIGKANNVYPRIPECFILAHSPSIQRSPTTRLSSRGFLSPFRLSYCSRRDSLFELLARFKVNPVRNYQTIFSLRSISVFIKQSTTSVKLLLLLETTSVKVKSNRTWILLCYFLPVLFTILYYCYCFRAQVLNKPTTTLGVVKTKIFPL